MAASWLNLRGCACPAQRGQYLGERLRPLLLSPVEHWPKIDHKWARTPQSSNGTATGGLAGLGEVPGVNAQERTREELRASLRTALAEALDFNRAEARKVAERDFEEETLSL